MGAGHPKSAAFSVVVVTLMSFVLSLIAAMVVVALRDVISYAFTEGEAVAAAVSDLCPLLAITLLLNGVQPVLSGTFSIPPSKLTILFLVRKFSVCLNLICGVQEFKWV